MGQGFVLGLSSGVFGASRAGVERATLWGEKWVKWGKLGMGQVGQVAADP